MTLIGATTENPYFEVNSALLSRSQIYELRALEPRAGARRCSSARSPTPSAGSPTRRRSPTRRSSCSPSAPAATRGRRSAALERAVEAARAGGERDRPRDGRGRAAAQGGHLRQGGRPALRLRLGADQVDARLRPRRRALLPGGDARGRRGPALHRPADGDPRLRGHRQRRPAGAARRDRRRRRPSTASGCPSARSTSPRRPSTWRWRRSRTPRRRRSRAAAGHVREHGAKLPPDYLRDAHYPGAKKLGRGAGLQVRARRAGRRRRPAAAAADEVQGERFYEPTDRGFEAELGERLAEARRRRGG